MFVFNENRVYADDADGQFVILNYVTGEYYAFDKASSAVLRALTSGCSSESVIRELQKLYGEDCTIAEKIEGFLSEMISLEILTPSGDEGGDAGPLLAVMEDETMPDLLFERHTDVADLLLMDPIHEVDEQMGWPVPKE